MSYSRRFAPSGRTSALVVAAIVALGAGCTTIAEERGGAIADSSAGSAQVPPASGGQASSTGTMSETPGGSSSPTANGGAATPGTAGTGTAGSAAGGTAPQAGGTSGSAGENAGAGGQGAGGLGSGGSAAGGAPSGDPVTFACEGAAELGVRFVGRYDCADGGVRMEWSGTGFVARVDATGLRATFSGSEVQYTVVVDGEVVSDLLVGSGAQSYDVVTSLPSGEHTVEVYRRGEASFGSSVVTAVEAVGGTLLPPTSAPARRIEIIGDSITCGYGNEGASESCPFSADTENHYMTYGAILARDLGAELSTVAWSGKGVVINYGGDTSTPMPGYYDLAVPSDSQSTWGFAWKPDVVIINLGTNDYSTDNDPTDADFLAGYGGLLDRVRANYPGALIVATLGPLLSGTDLATARTNIAAAVAERIDAGDTLMAVHELAANNPSPGCDWHPSIATHQAMAAELTPTLTNALGW